jgi:hypothetical protein
LLVVDNDPAESRGTPAAAVVRRFTDLEDLVEVLVAPSNFEAAGGYNVGLERVVDEAADDDLAVLLTDHRPLPPLDVLGGLMRFFDRIGTEDIQVAAVGLQGERFSWRRARTLSVPREALGAPIVVDVLASGWAPLYHVGAVRSVGLFSIEMHAALTDLELGLRLRRVGRTLWAHGQLAEEVALYTGEPRETRWPSLTAHSPEWSGYYELRNLIRLLIEQQRPATATRVAVSRGLLKPLASLPRRPAEAVASLRQNLEAAKDARSGRMGASARYTPAG